MNPKNQIKFDCMHFTGDKPCKYSKETGIKCAECKNYKKKVKALIIKLDAPGDVLRTTSIIQGIYDKHNINHVTWITKANAVPLLQNNPFIQKIMTVENCMPTLLTESFDIVINTSNDTESAQLAQIAKTDKKVGFLFNNHIIPTNQAAQNWLEMGIFDDTKQVNTKTYQQLMQEIVETNHEHHNTLFYLTEKEKELAENFRKENDLESSLVIGLNTGAGERWKQKRINEEKTAELAKILMQRLDAKVILLGGPEENKRNTRILNLCPELIDAGSNWQMREFASLINLCNCIVTSDSLAMHLALGLKKNVVAFFGPTSSKEIELYGLGKKITPAMDCLCCYKANCNKKPNCMDLIKIKDIADAVEELIK